MDVLSALWPKGIPDKYWLNIFALPDRTSYYYNSLPTRAQLERTLVGADAYFGVGLARHDDAYPRWERKSRFTQADIECIPGVWIDIDLKGDNTHDSIRKLINSTIPPSLVVATGGGFHVYWRFSEPLFGNAKIRAILGGWKAYMNSQAQTVGVSLDSMVIEPARVLRLDGFVNSKPGRNGFVVSIEHYEIDTVYHHSDIPTLEYETRFETRPPISTTGVVGEGLRNDSLFRFCCYLRGVYGADFEQMAVLAQVFYDTMMAHDPPMSSREIQQVVRSATRHKREIRMNDKAATAFDMMQQRLASISDAE